MMRAKKITEFKYYVEPPSVTDAREAVKKHGKKVHSQRQSKRAPSPPPFVPSLTSVYLSLVTS